MTIEQFGAFERVGNDWVFSTYTGKPFTPSDFVEWYSCPNTVLKAGQKYTDPSNWVGCDELVQGEYLWYFIARKSDGQRVQGHAIIETAPRTKP